MARVQLKSLEKVYGKFKAVHGIDLEIEDGEFMVLVGPSGCAKSTTLRMIAGLERITGGEIRIGDDLVNDKPPGQRGIAMVFQNYALYPHMKVKNNLSFGLRLKHAPKAEIAASTEEVSHILEIEDYLERLPKQLSGGQAQRVAVGRALIKKPQVFLFDEPLSNLDAKLRASMRVRITDLHKQLLAEGMHSTVVYVTHDQTEAMTMGNRICVMKEGRIMQVADPFTLYRKPANAFVAGFIGSPEMNIGDATLVDGNKLRIGTQTFTIDDKARARIDKDAPSEVTFGVRPQHFTVVDQNAEEGLLGRISHVEFMGHEVYLYITVEDQSFIVVVPATGIERQYLRDDAIRIMPQEDALHIFHRRTGENISLSA
ncbi:sugar ABC transporter ATP-binding protein [Martelella sp. AD-3]|uniref:ABC transporter ATP-binding protein n=1 Tax=Martelella sp. AD-3 TaxID=686597 RepID=UPI0007778EF7|nr:ABC transporter ATP-binding protein [Martelella sp. AD-3]AMM85719.1 sugar ABC transporter ATP-binding protein [Martelella sp. AD-3]MAM13673.1 ABC transporter ATP-binding protein [Rhizobiaceae bacterium]|tara:strand:+ start:258 stop:1370 length:1113 start_codon:yes stop_codon:yes gene_type:complete